MPVVTAALVEELGEPECRQLLATASVGRIGFTEQALPMITPMHYTVHGDEVILCSVSPDKVAGAGRSIVVAFEADRYEAATREGWSVTIVGPTRLVTAPAEIAALDALGFAPWVGHPDRQYVAVEMSVVRGHRIGPGACEDPFPSPRNAATAV
jgi:nitroimidazol reductase NimA-like FMN-containing flavoprotein (pyridoxamine 5'-phosphate oxidase superfamily)